MLRSASAIMGSVIVWYLVMFNVLFSIHFVYSESSSKNDRGERKTSSRNFGSFNLNNIQQELVDAASMGFKQVDNSQVQSGKSTRNTSSMDSQLNRNLLQEADLLSRKLNSIVNTELGYEAMQVWQHSVCNFWWIF